MAGKALFSVGGSSGLVWNDFLEICQACDDMGYHGFYPSDHLMRIQLGHDMARAWRDIGNLEVSTAFAPKEAK